MKQLSIGVGSKYGKTLMHSGGKNGDPEKIFENRCQDKEFKEAIADGVYSIVSKLWGKMAFINIMKNIWIDCDCVRKANPSCMKIVVILSSTDPVAIDKACLDLIYKSDDIEKKY